MTSTSASASFRSRSSGAASCASAAPELDHDQPEIGVGGALACAAHPLRLDRALLALAGGAQPRGVGDDQREAVEREVDLDDVARRSGDVADDRRVAPGERVEEGGFAGVGRTHDRDAVAVAQALAGARIVERRRDLALDRRRAPGAAWRSCRRGDPRRESRARPRRARARRRAARASRRRPGRARRRAAPAPGAPARRSRRRPGRRAPRRPPARASRIERAARELARAREAQAGNPASASMTPARTARPPWTCSSATSSPVSEAGPAKNSASASSSGPPSRGSRSRARVARRGFLRAAAAPRASSASPAAGPEMRMTAIAEIPTGVAGA